VVADAGSFRDPSGQIFSENGRIYRSIFQPGVDDYEAARGAGVYTDLMEEGLLVSHEEVPAGPSSPQGTVICLAHPRLPMISYPWEWPFSILKDAALIHLKAMEKILPRGFWLRDASAFNAQFDGSRVVLIDTLSVGKRVPESPWVAYGQFCSHFLAPMAMAAYGDIRMLSLWRSFIDGFPLDLAAGAIPFWRRWRPGLLMHLALHARAQDLADRKEDIAGKGPPKIAKKQPRVSDRGLIGLIRSLHRTIEGIRWKRSSRLWEAYGDIRTYQDEDVTRKSEYVDKVAGALNPDTVWDLGANTGEFSLIAASHGAFVVSIDGDPACTEYLYQKACADKSKSILPLTMDLANPSPGLGWDSRERFSLTDRGPADLVLALALIHHLVLSACVPIKMVAQWLGTLCQDLLVEFVPPDDPMVKKLIRNRRGEHLPYSMEVFQTGFGQFFSFEDQETLPNGRTLFLLRRL